MGNHSKEDEAFLVLIRKTLAAVAKDTAPTAGHPHLLKNTTIQMMRECFTEVSQREHDHRQRHHLPKQQPYYVDEPKDQSAQVLPWPHAKAKPSQESGED